KNCMHVFARTRIHKCSLCEGSFVLRNFYMVHTCCTYIIRTSSREDSSHRARSQELLHVHACTHITRRSVHKSPRRMGIDTTQTPK
ncbi:MAG: hypothetical protein AAGJ35_08370, partial [Myxococcota bacterium]